MKQKYNKKRRKRRKASAFHPHFIRHYSALWHLTNGIESGQRQGKCYKKDFEKFRLCFRSCGYQSHTSVAPPPPSLPPARPPALPPPHQIFHPQWENILEDININPILNSGRKPNPARPGDGIMEAPPALPSRSRPDSTSGIGDIRLWRRQQVPPTNHSAPARLH